MEPLKLEDQLHEAVMERLEVTVLCGFCSESGSVFGVDAKPVRV